MLMCLLVLVMLIARALAGSYAEERQKSEIVPNYPTTPESVEKPQQVYTRTIIRPVAYSYISANVQPKIHKFSEETTSYITENLDFENQPGDVKPTPQIRKFFVGRRTVLPGNFDDLQHADLSLGEKIQQDSVTTILPNLNKETTTEAHISVASAPLGKYKRLLNRYPQWRSTINDVYERPEKSRISSNLYLGRRPTPQRLPPIPEITLRPPPPAYIHKPQIHEPDKNIEHEELDDKEEETEEEAEEEEDSKVKPSTRRESISERPVSEKEEVEEFSELEEYDDEDDEESEHVLQEPPKLDQTNSESEHKEESKKKKATKKESSEGSEHESHSKSKKGEKGEKGYKKSNKHEKAEKGHHDKESHSGKYHEEKGEEKKHHKGEGFYGEHHKEEKGKKGKKYGEGKNHKKGHSTHGEHNIVKKNEYIKSTKFYDEDHDDGEAVEHGEYHGEHAEKEGGKKEGGKNKKGYHKEGKAKKGHHDKGHEDEEHGGFEKDQGSEDFHGHEEKHSAEKGEKHSKKWKKE